MQAIVGLAAETSTRHHARHAVIPGYRVLPRTRPGGQAGPTGRAEPDRPGRARAFVTCCCRCTIAADFLLLCACRALNMRACCAWPAVTRCMIACCLLGFNIFIIPNKHLELVETSLVAAIIICLSNRRQASQWLKPVTDLRVDVPVSRPVSLARGRRHDLRENTHSHHRGSFITLERILFGEFHALGYHASKTRRISIIERNAVLIKERCYHRIHFFGS